MSLISFIKGSYSEFRHHVEWPKWPYLQSQTNAVVIGTIILSLFIFGVDTLFSTVIDNIYRILISLLN